MNLQSLVNWCHNSLLSTESAKIVAYKIDVLVLTFGKGLLSISAV